MRQTFDADDSAALDRMRGARKVGRKHNHQPRGRAAQKAMMRPINQQRQTNLTLRKYHMAVRAYWRGELDGFPPLVL